MVAENCGASPRQSELRVMNRPKQYAHVFVFRCVGCARPVSATYLTDRPNRELADAHMFTLTCECNWAGRMTGFAAVRHWVEPWDFNRRKSDAWSEPAEPPKERPNRAS